MTMDLKFTGARELERMLMDLPHTLARASGRRVLKKAAVPIKEAAEQNAADDPDTLEHDLHRSIGISTAARIGTKRSKSEPDEVNVFVGVQVDLHQSAGDPNGRYAAAIVNEFGSEKMEAHPFMRPAWDAKKQEAWDIIVKELRIDVAKTVARFVKRSG